MIDYKNGKIYRLVCNTTGDQYIGSTTQSLSQRLGGHKTQYKRFLEDKIPKKYTSFSILSNNNFEIILLEEFPCENKNELERRERHFIETVQCVNKIKPAQTKEELQKHQQTYQQEHKEELQAYQQAYQQEHKEELQAYQQTYRHEHKGEKQAYRQEHKEDIQKKRQAYYQAHKEEKYKNQQKYRQKLKENKLKEIEEKNQ